MGGVAEGVEIISGLVLCYGAVCACEEIVVAVVAGDGCGVLPRVVGAVGWERAGEGSAVDCEFVRDGGWGSGVEVYVSSSGRILRGQRTDRGSFDVCFGSGRSRDSRGSIWPWEAWMVVFGFWV